MDALVDMNMMFDPPRKPEAISPVERLLNDFEAHEAQEEKSIEIYKTTLGAGASPATRFLLQMIIADEEKHRAAIHAMAATLKGSLNWSKPADCLDGAADLAELNGKLRAATEEFIQVEREGIKEYKILLSESAGYYHGLFEVLIGAMIRDSEKHVELLEFLKNSLERA